MSRLLPITYCEDCLYDGGDGVCYNPKSYEKLQDGKDGYIPNWCPLEDGKRHAELVELVKTYFECKEDLHHIATSKCVSGKAWYEVADDLEKPLDFFRG